MNTLPEDLKHSLVDPANAWSIGVWGAIAEFSRAPDEPAEVTFTDHTVRIETGKGKLTVDLDAPHLRAVEHEGRSAHTGRTFRTVDLCLPESEARMHGRTVLTEIEDGDGPLFDLGLGAATIDACVRAEEPFLRDMLREHAGRSILTGGNSVMTALKEASPPRVFRSRVATIEVRQRIGSTAKNVRTPEGPHTHILPKLLEKGRVYAKGTPIPEGWLPVLTLHPAAGG